ncbi:MAG TPA: DUF72 domain-containing protein [bacterium]|nr:DUF72 domain-containing protein [bacterium]
MEIRVGTCGYSYDDWRGVYYPPGLPRGEMLAWYSGTAAQTDLLAGERGPVFDTVEVNATYYRLPPARVFSRMAAVTPDGFLFSVKAPGGITHPSDYGTLDDGLVERYCAAVTPLAEAGKLGPTLLQFPYRFKADGRNVDYLRAATDAFRDLQPAVEFRHRSWLTDETLESLRGAGLTFVSVDMPALPGLLPPVLVATTDTAYVRFHGRRKEAWWRGGNEERYDYDYALEELEPWVERVRALGEGSISSDVEPPLDEELRGDSSDLLRLIRLLSGPVKRVFLYFNNHPKGKALSAARSLQSRLAVG